MDHDRDEEALGARRRATMSDIPSKQAANDVLDIEQAAELLGVSIKTFNKVLHSESIPGRKIGREWKFSRQALIDWIGAGRSDDFYRQSRELEPQLGGSPELERVQP